MKEIVQRKITEEESLPLDQQPLYHTNCAENLFGSANEKYNLGFPQEMMNAIIPYGAGMQCKRTCGACLGAIGALGLMYGEKKPTANKKLKAAVSKYVELFVEKFGALNCSEIKPRWQDENNKCTPTKLAAAELFDYVVEHIDEIYKEYLENEGK